MPDPSRQARGRLGGLKSWSQTPDRAARMAAPHSSGPGSLEWHVARLDPERFADATEEQKLAAADAARKLWFARLSYASAQARRNKRGAA